MSIDWGNEGFTPTSDGDGLRATIIAEPDDDIARLVYADWLDENGQPARAAFVRAQVRAAQAEPFSPEALAYEAEAERALEGNRGAWTKALVSRVVRCEFRRGFIEHAQVNVASFPRDAADLFAAEPIRSLHLVRFASHTDETVSLLPFFETPQLERVTHLDLTGLHLSPVELEPLGESRYLDNLTDLNLRDLPVMPDWIEGLLDGLALPSLAGLNLADLSHLGPTLADAFHEAEHRRFARLDLSRIPFTSPQIQSVLASRCVREVEELRLGWMAFAGHEGAISHLNPGWTFPWNHLRLLDLNGQGIGDDGVTEMMKEFARRREPVPLRWLGLAHNLIGSDAVKALVRSDPAKLKLYHLDIRGNGLPSSQIAALQTRFEDATISCK